MWDPPQNTIQDKYNLSYTVIYPVTLQFKHIIFTSFFCEM
jgi:hypothetical protein